jgi:hypothetical protein
MKRFTNAALIAATLGMALASAAPAADAVVAGCAAESCPQACGKTVCRPICTTKTVTTRTYTDHCKEVCLPRPFACLFPKSCGCSCVWHQKDLVVKIHKCEVPVKKCVPVHEPACTTCAPACQAPCATCAPTAPAYMPAPVVQPAVIGLPTMPAVMPSGK